MFAAKATLFLLAFVGSAYAYCGIMTFRENPGPCQRPAELTHFIDSLSADEKSALRKIIEDNGGESGVKAVGWVKLTHFLDSLADGKKVQLCDHLSTLIYSLQEEGRKVFEMLVAARRKQFEDEKRDLPEIAVWINRIQFSAEDGSMTLMQECTSFYMFLEQMMREDKNLSETQRKVAQKVYDELGNCVDYSRQIADILIENRLPPALNKEL